MLHLSTPRTLPISIALLFSLLSPLPVNAGLAPSFKTSHPASPRLEPDDVVRFTKNLYQELGDHWGNTTAVTDKYRDEFQDLNASTAGQLGETLSALFEIRMLDLQASVRHARKMRNVIQSFTTTTPPASSDNNEKPAVSTRIYARRPVVATIVANK